jgi:hypothetical protein
MHKPFTKAKITKFKIVVAFWAQIPNEQTTTLVVLLSHLRIFMA